VVAMMAIQIWWVLKIVQNVMVDVKIVTLLILQCVPVAVQVIS